MNNTNRRELEILEVELNQGRMNQEVKSTQAGLRAERLKVYQEVIRVLMSGQTLEQVIENIKRKLEELDI